MAVKLTEKKLNEFKQDYGDGKLSKSEIARKYKFKSPQSSNNFAKRNGVVYGELTKEVNKAIEGIVESGNFPKKYKPAGMLIATKAVNHAQSYLDDTEDVRELVATTIKAMPKVSDFDSFKEAFKDEPNANELADIAAQEAVQKIRLGTELINLAERAGNFYSRRMKILAEELGIDLKKKNTKEAFIGRTPEEIMLALKQAEDVAN